MYLAQLEEKKLSIEQLFVALEKTNNELKQQINDNTEELLKLSGEHRLVTQLLQEYGETEVKPKKEKLDG